MYGKYSLFYESHKNQGYYVHAQTEYQATLWGEWPGDPKSGLGTRLTTALKHNSVYPNLNIN